MAKMKGKEWYQILAPKLFGNKVLGETLTSDPDTLTGRVISSTLFDLTGDTNKYYVKLYFKIDEIKEGKAKTRFYGHECTRDFIARIVQINTGRIDTNDVVKFKDGSLRVKMIAICNRQVKAGVATSIRKLMSKLVLEKGSKMSIDDFLTSFMNGSIQGSMKEEVNKIYPLRYLEIRKVDVL